MATINSYILPFVINDETIEKILDFREAIDAYNERKVGVFYLPRDYYEILGDDFWQILLDDSHEKRDNLALLRELFLHSPLNIDNDNSCLDVCDDIVCDSCLLTITEGCTIEIGMSRERYLFIDYESLNNVLRLITSSFNDWNDVNNKLLSAIFPNLLFVPDSTESIEKLGTCERTILCELLNHLEVLEKSALDIYDKVNHDTRQAIDMINSTGSSLGFNLHCTGLGSSEHAESFSKTFKYQDIEYTGKFVPHTKLERADSNKRIYFAWDTSPQIEPKRICIGKIGDHWNS